MGIGVLDDDVARAHAKITLAVWCESEAAGEWGERLKQEWSDELPMSAFSYGSTKKAKWRCRTCGHAWEGSLNARTNSNKCGCPMCKSHRNAGPSETNNLAVWCDSAEAGDLGRQLRSEWHDDRSMTDFTRGSHRHAKWRCERCAREWEARVASRSSGHGGCSGPQCRTERRTATTIAPTPTMLALAAALTGAGAGAGAVVPVASAAHDGGAGDAGFVTMLMLGDRAHSGRDECDAH